MVLKQNLLFPRLSINGPLLSFLMITLIGSTATSNDFTEWQKQPAQLSSASVTREAATLQSAEWGYLVASAVAANVEVSATVTIETPASQFDFFGSSWSAWPDPKFGDRGFDAGLILRNSEDGSSGYRVQLSSKYQEVALVRFPDGGYVRSVPCVIKTQTPIRVRVKAAGSLIRVFIDNQEIIQYVDRLEPQMPAGRIGIGASSLARATWSDFAAREADAEAAPAPTEHRLQLSYRRWLGGRLFVFDNNEPILQLHHEQDPSMFAKLRPGLRPLLTFDSHWGLENQGAYKEASVTWTAPEVNGGGDAVTAKWSALHVQKRFTTQSSLKVGYDSDRDCYTYDISSELEMLPGEPFQFRYGFDFEHHTPLDPFRWQYLLIRDGDGKMTYRPLSPYDPGTLENIQTYYGQRVWHGRTGDVHVVSPAVKYEIQPEWIQYQDDTGTVSKRRLNTAVCAAFYDTGVSFNAVTARPGDKIRVQYRYTGYPAEETNELFKTATVQNNPRIDPKHHFVFLRDQWPTIRFDNALAMDKPWWGGRPMMSGHNARPAYDYVQEGEQGMLRLGPVSYAAAAVGPEKMEPGPYLVSARVKSVNTYGPGGRLELIMLKKGDLNGNSFIRWDVGNIVSEQTRYLGRGSFDWRDVSFVAEIPKEATGLALGLGNSGTGAVFVSEVRIEPLGKRQPPPETLSATPPPDEVIHDALWDLRMEEQNGLHIFNHGSSTYRTMELANLDWVTDEGHSAIRFSENPPGRRDFPALGILDLNLRNPAQRQNYEAVCHGAFALGGHHGGGEKLNGLTFAAWIKPAAEMGKSTSYSGKGDIIGYGARRFILGLQGQTAPYSLVAGINVNDTIDSSTKLDADRWYHVAMTCIPSGENWEVRLYVDGQEVGAGVSKSLPASSTIPDSLVLGAELFYLHGAYYRGLMSRVLVVTRTMDGHEIRSLMNSRALRETKP